MARHLTALGMVAALVTPALVTPVAAETIYTPACILEPGQRRAVTRVIDGETLALDDGTEVRLIGALAPLPPPVATTGAATPWAPAQAARLGLQALAEGRSVELSYAGTRYDRYGRRLAQVFVPGPDGRQWLQAALLAKGLARAYGLPRNDACLKDLLKIEAAARDARTGIWSNAAYQIRDALRPGALRRYRHRFQIVEGRVAKVGSSRSRLYLNFGDDWRRDFTIGIARRRLQSFAAQGLRPEALAGRWVRVRGWIETRGGPFIDAQIPGQIEVLPDR